MHIASWSGSQPFIHELKTSQCNHEYILLRTQGSSHLPVSGVILFMILYFRGLRELPHRILLTISRHNKQFKLPYQIIWGKVALRPCCKKQAYLDTKSLATWPRSMLIFDISLHQSFYILIWTEDAVIEFIYKVNRCLARYSPRATTANWPTNRAPNEPVRPGPNRPIMPILGQIWSFLGKKSFFLLEKS